MNTLDRILHDCELAAPPQESRRRAARQLAERGLPSAREEDWRYANLRALDAVASFRPSASAMPAVLAPELLPPAIPGFARLTYLNGRLHAPASTSAAPMVETTPIEWTGPEQRFGLLNDMFATDGAELRVQGDAAIEILFISTPQHAGTAVYPRLSVQLEAGSRLQLVERHLGAPGELGLVCPSASLQLARGARLTHYRLQQCAAGTVYIDSLRAHLQDEAAYHVRSVAVGAGTARSSATVRLAGRGAALTWHGLAVGHDEQVHDGLLKVEHCAPATRTEEVFRGIAAERARVAFNGQIHIDSAAPGSQACQSLRGLVDGAAAEIDLRPQLTINTDDVRAAHGATSGRLDENLLFYMLSRGLDPATARALLKWAFLGDILKHIELPELRRAAEAAAAGQLPDVLAAGALSGSGAPP
ncbi:MAG: SufB/SufD family protein [Steroidobacterales bacterium]